MAETRMLPKNTPRSTGIRQTTQQARPAPAGSSHVSASAGATRAVHDHVVAARQPTAAPSRPQAAKVQLIDRPRPAAGKVVGNGLAHVTVELIDRPGSQVVAAAATRGTPGAAAGVFPPEEALLIASLLERHQEAAEAARDQEGAQTARSALDTLTRAVNARRSPPPAPQVTRVAANGTRAASSGTEHSVVGIPVPADPLVEATRGAQVVQAQTTTVVLGPAE